MMRAPARLLPYFAQKMELRRMGARPRIQKVRPSRLIIGKTKRVLRVARMREVAPRLKKVIRFFQKGW